MRALHQQDALPLFFAAIRSDSIQISNAEKSIPIVGRRGKQSFGVLSVKLNVILF